MSSERLEWNEPRRTGDGGNDEFVEVVENCPREELPERPRVALIGPSKSGKIPGPLPLVDDRRRVTESDKQKVKHQSTSATVAIKEWVDLFKPSVQGATCLRERGLFALHKQLGS